MRLLALEAGGPVLSAALFDGERVAGLAWRRAPRQPTELLAPMVRDLLRETGWEPKSVRALACGSGPGSFTGLRSSMAFGAGWALAVEDLRLEPVSTLMAWAEAFCPASCPAARVLLDGRRAQVYRGLFLRADGGWRAALKPALMDLASALGEGPGEPPAALISDLTTAPAGALGLDLESAALALAVGRLALRTLASDSVPGPWEPEYLRRSEAEILWERLHPSIGGA